MKRLSKYMVAVMILLLAVVLMTGCSPWALSSGKVTGGGWFISDCGEGTKCTFGFNAQGDGEWCLDMEWKGQFQFNDHAKPDATKIHAAVMKLYEYNFDERIYKFTGDVKGGGVVVVSVQDFGEPGVDAGDGIRVEFGVDTWEGYLGGGNIQVH